MLLHASNISMNLYGQDIDPLAVAMCKINGALYAPWMSFPLPEAILGNAGTASEPSDDDIPLFRVHECQERFLFDPWES